jgi:molybdopterin-biosynthesis enzyme MoeA-like protein
VYKRQDDITIESVARSIGRKVEYSEPSYSRLLDKWRSRNKDTRIPDATVSGMRKMSRIIEGFRTFENTAGAVEAQVGEVGTTRIAILPGVPREYSAILESEAFQEWLPRLEGSIVSKEILYQGRESQIASLLEIVQISFPSVEIGSYPQGPMKVIVRITGEAQTVGKAYDEIDRRLG